jgi:hypothetical protein
MHGYLPLVCLAHYCLHLERVGSLMFVTQVVLSEEDCHHRIAIINLCNNGIDLKQNNARSNCLLCETDIECENFF